MVVYAQKKECHGEDAIPPRDAPGTRKKGGAYRGPSPLASSSVSYWSKLLGSQGTQYCVPQGKGVPRAGQKKGWEQI